jgi:uncharacterized protein (DUF2461 family)
VTVPSSDAGGLPLDLDQIEAAFDPDKPLADLEQRARHREDHSSYICVNRADVFAVVAWVRALEAEVQQLRKSISDVIDERDDFADKLEEAQAEVQ